MWAWEDEPRSTADGILDDETYDWLGVLDAVDGQRGLGRRRAGGGDRGGARARPVGDGHPGERHRYGRAWPASSPSASQVADDERVAVVFSGVER